MERSSRWLSWLYAGFCSNLESRRFCLNIESRRFCLNIESRRFLCEHRIPPPDLVDYPNPLWPTGSKIHSSKQTMYFGLYMFGKPALLHTMWESACAWMWDTFWRCTLSRSPIELSICSCYPHMQLLSILTLTTGWLGWAALSCCVDHYSADILSQLQPSQKKFVQNCCCCAHTHILLHWCEGVL